MKENIKKFLKNSGFLPLTRWKNFEIIHTKAFPEKQKKKEDLEIVRKNVLKKNGLYIYEKNKKIIYVGKAKPLFYRIKNHYLLAYQELSGDTKDKIWHRFFSSKKNLGKLKIYWKELEEEKERQIIEKMLDYILCPTFNSFKEKYGRKK